MRFEEYLGARGAALVRIARLLTADDRRADMLVRDVLTRAYPRWNEIVKTERPDVYLRRLLVGRDRWRRASAPIEADGTGRDPMWAVIARLPARQRAVLALGHVEDLDDAVIAEILDCAPATVRAARRRAMTATADAHRAMTATADGRRAIRAGNDSRHAIRATVDGRGTATSVDDQVTASLRRRAAAPVDLSALIATARQRGQLRSRRQRATRWTAAAAVVLAVAAVGLSTAPRRTDPPLRFDGIEPYFYGDTRLPRAPGVPGAGSRPDLVGTDPSVLHFDAPALTDRARWHTWTTGPGYERLEAAITPESADGGVVYVTIGRWSAVDAIAPEENMRTVGVQRLTGDLWLRVEATGDVVATEAERALRLDESQRCVLPYRVPVRPRGTDVATCYVGFRSGHYAEGGLLLRAGGGRSMEVQAQYVPGFPNRKTANHRCGDRPAFLFPGEEEVEVLLGYNGFYLSARIGGPYRGFTIADADALLAEVTMATDVEQMRTWPPSPISP